MHLPQVVAKQAHVRQGISPQSTKVRTLMQNDIVAAFEESAMLGHRRIRIGDGEWISLKTDSGKIIAVHIVGEESERATKTTRQLYKVSTID